MRSKTLVLVTVALLTSAALVFAGETPEPAAEQPAPQQTAQAQQPAAETPSLAAEATPQAFQLATEEACPAKVFTGLTAGEPCGGVTCGPGQYCCNPTCNACVYYGMSCTQQVCN